MNYEEFWCDLYSDLGEYVTKHIPEDEWDRGYIHAYRDIMGIMDNIIYKEKHKNDHN